MGGGRRGVIGCERAGYCREVEVAGVLEALGYFRGEGCACELVGACEGWFVVQRGVVLRHGSGLVRSCECCRCPSDGCRQLDVSQEAEMAIDRIYSTDFIAHARA